MEQYGLRLVAAMLESNHYYPFDDVRWELTRSEVINPNVGAVDVFFCFQGPGEWRDFDTDEVTQTASSEPGMVIYEMRRDGESAKVWAIKERASQGCEFVGASS